MKFYWVLLQKDGTALDIAPDSVEAVRKMWANGGPIKTAIGDIPISEIKKFYQSDRMYNSQPLLEAAARVFNEPLIEKDGGITSYWVKKLVTPDIWNRHYSAIPSYKKLGLDGAMVIVAFAQPAHQIDTSIVEYCTKDDITKLTSKRT